VPKSIPISLEKRLLSCANMNLPTNERIKSVASPNVKL